MSNQSVLIGNQYSSRIEKILVGYNKSHSYIFNKWALFASAVIFIGLAVGLAFNSVVTPVKISLAITNGIAGLGYLLFGLLTYSQWSPYAPKISVDSEFITIKKGLFQKSDKTAWKEIKQIVFGKNTIAILNHNESNNYFYQSSWGISVKIKNMICVQAENKSIQIQSV